MALLLAAPPHHVIAQTPTAPGAITLARVPLYTGPSTSYARPEPPALPAQTAFEVVARHPLGHWVQVRASDDANVRGWAQTGALPLYDAGVSLADVPLDTSLADYAPDALPNDERLRLLHTTPVVPTALDVRRLRAVMMAGRARGAAPFSVTKIGDSNMASPYLLSPLAEGNVDLGPYTHLRPAADAFGPSLARRSVAARQGMNITSVFDPIWADSTQCDASESPLACELRLAQPAVAVVMFGQNDVRAVHSERYAERLAALVEAALANGTVPVLCTFTNTPDNSEVWGAVVRLNAITVETAQRYNVPLFNFFLAATDLPGRGLGDDLAHLTQGGASITLDGREAAYGLSLYNLGVLHMLQTLYDDVFTVQEAPRS